MEGLIEEYKKFKHLELIFPCDVLSEVLRIQDDINQTPERPQRIRKAHKASRFIMAVPAVRDSWCHIEASEVLRRPANGHKKRDIMTGNTTIDSSRLKLEYLEFMRKEDLVTPLVFSFEFSEEEGDGQPVCIDVPVDKITDMSFYLKSTDHGSN